MITSGWQREGVETEFVGDGADRSGQDAGPDQGFARSGVGDVAAEGDAASARGGRLRRGGFQDDVASADLPGDAAVREDPPECFFQGEAVRKSRRRRCLLPDHISQGCVIDEAHAVALAKEREAAARLVLGGQRGCDKI